MGELFRRHAANPILTPGAIPADVGSAFNPAATLVGEDVVLLVRAEDRRGISALWVARSADGISDWRIDARPLLQPEDPYEEWGCEDARLTFVPELGEWVIAYTAYSPVGPGVALARTRDFASVERIGLVLSPENKDATLFPRRFDGGWVLLHRPVAGRTGHMWLASSPDLIHWGRPRVLARSRGEVWWDGSRIGAGAQPLETDAGWLLLYHGVKTMVSGPVYRVGLILLDRDDPSSVIARSEEWVFAPDAPYERSGDVPSVVFPCGAVIRDGEVWMYYGAADSTVCLAIASLDDLLASLSRSSPGSGGRGRR
jgi:predicted GH43/DUF377 family glycosyl hydrolase